jgi:hypothetical protein
MFFFVYKEKKKTQNFTLISNLWKLVEKGTPRKSYLPNPFAS